MCSLLLCVAVGCVLLGVRFLKRLLMFVVASLAVLCATLSAVGCCLFTIIRFVLFVAC